MSAPGTLDRVLVDIELQQACKAVTLPQPAEIRHWIEAAVRAVGGAAERRLEIVVRIVGEEEIRSLNRTWRHKDRVTNVLAFPAFGVSGSGPARLPEDLPRPLGDLVICGSVVEREARQQGKSRAAHWSHMLIHGTLHLLGFDHQNDQEAAAMERLETEILAGFGFADPYVCP